MLSPDRPEQDAHRRAVAVEAVVMMPMLRRRAIALTRSVDSADDLVQETLLRAVAHADMFALGTNLVAWLFTIMRNVHLSHARRAFRTVPWDPRLEDSLAASTDGADDAMQELDFDKLRAALLCLPAAQRDVLIAVGYLGMRYEDAARALGAALGTIKSRVNHARITLADLQDNCKIESVDPGALLAHAARVPRALPYHPIAAALLELYADYAPAASPTPLDEDFDARDQLDDD